MYIYRVYYIKNGNGKEQQHTSDAQDLATALAVAHELTRDFVADYTRVVRIPVTKAAERRW
jgi:hypothetical protein